MREIRERAQRFNAKAGLIQLGFYWKQWAPLDPAVAHAEIFREAALIVGGAQKFVGFPEAVPFFLGKRGVAALHHVIIRRDEVQRRGVGGSVGIRIVLEPVHEIRALRNFVRDFAVFALEFADEGERGARSGKIAGSVQRKRSPEGIAAEKPPEARALARAGSAIAGDEAGAEIGIGDEALEPADAPPVVSLLELRVRQSEADGAGEIVLVILRGFLQQCRVIRRKVLVRFL